MNIPEAATFADALDGLGAGLFLVDKTGRIIHANASGHAMLQERSVLREGDGRLVPCEVHAATALKELFAIVGGGDGVFGGKPIAVPLRTRDGNHYVAHILPLTSGARRSASVACPPVAALFVHKAALEAPSPGDVIAKFYNLTASELRVLHAIIDVGGVPETARALGVSEATVKTHLHRVFRKTGASRQADLVKLVAGFSSPLVGGSRPYPIPHRNQSIDERGTGRIAAAV
jgi:DNA-binding CsgD family transcriptional regulator